MMYLAKLFFLYFVALFLIPSTQCMKSDSDLSDSEIGSVKTSQPFFRLKTLERKQFASHDGLPCLQAQEMKDTIIPQSRSCNCLPSLNSASVRSAIPCMDEDDESDEWPEGVPDFFLIPIRKKSDGTWEIQEVKIRDVQTQFLREHCYGKQTDNDSAAIAGDTLQLPERLSTCSDPKFAGSSWKKKFIAQVIRNSPRLRRKKSESKILQAITNNDRVKFQTELGKLSLQNRPLEGHTGNVLLSELDKSIEREQVSIIIDMLRLSLNYQPENLPIIETITLRGRMEFKNSRVKELADALGVTPRDNDKISAIIDQLAVYQENHESNDGDDSGC
jgi:hypothetical protein